MKDMTLVLLRHGESLWNQENLFTGWTDVELSEKGQKEARQAGRLLKEEGYDFDCCYTSYLKRAIHTLNFALGEMDRDWLPVTKTWKLNERHYGALQGLNKADTAEKYSEEQVKIWRRSFDVQPPALAPDDKRCPALQEMYRNVDPKELPLAESLKDTIARVVPYFESEILPQLQSGKRVLIAAHGNSLRALIMHLEKLTPDEILTRNLPTGVPLVYHLSEDLQILSSKYLGDEAAIQAKIQAVANQGKKQ